MPLHGGCGNLLSARGFQPLPVPALAALRSLQCIWGVFYYSNALGTAAVRLEIPLSSPSGNIPTPAAPPALIHTATAAVFLQTSAYNHAEFEPLNRRTSAGRGAAEGDVEPPSALAPSTILWHTHALPPFDSHGCEI